MIGADNNRVSNIRERRFAILRLFNGFREVVFDFRKAIVICAYTILAIILYNNKRLIISFILTDNRRIDIWITSLVNAVFPLIISIGFIAIMILLGTPIKSTSVRNSFKRIGLTNHLNETPLLIRIRNDKDKGVLIYEFETNGIPRYRWEKLRFDIEAELNLNITKFSDGKNRRRLLLYTVPGNNKLRDCIDWENSFLCDESFVLVLGESLIGQEKVNLSRVPHILLGGSTGSGKSILLKLLLMQCICKDAEITIADFKGGVDFSGLWDEHCSLILDESELLNRIENIVDELEHRKIKLRMAGCSNIDKYNLTAKQKMKRIIFACDEIAEILDKTGRSSDEKKKIGVIENRISTIARQGRAFGIHLILATQRPDASILPGQIKNNIDYKVCGRADNVLSLIILDNTSASDNISKDAQGRFIIMIPRNETRKQKQNRI